MSNVLEEITKQAIQLPRHERLVLAGLLLELDESGPDAEVEAAWERELLARIQAVDDGSAIGISFDEVLRDADERLTP